MYLYFSLDSHITSNTEAAVAPPTPNPLFSWRLYSLIDFALCFTFTRC